MNDAFILQAAGIHDADEAALLVEAGFTHLGFPLRLPVHREDLTDAQAAAVIRGLPDAVTPVLVTYLDRAEAVASLCRRVGARMVQLHGDLPAYEIARLRAMAPDLAICKSLVVRPEDHDLLDGDVSAFSPWVDAFLTDTFDPATGASGATGRTHDWAISRRLAARSSRPLILAGGLTAANVAAAVARVRPAGVDVHTGIEGPDGRKDATLAREFVRHATAAELPSERGCGRIL